MPWDLSPSYDEADMEGVLFCQRPLRQGTFPASAAYPAPLNAADHQQAQTLLELQIKMNLLEHNTLKLQQQLILQRYRRFRGQRSEIVPEDTVSNDIQNSAQESSPLFAQQTTPSRIEDAVTNGPLLPLQYDNAMPNSVHGDATGSLLFGTPPAAELPSDLSDPNLMHNSYGSASSNGGIWSDGNYLLPSHPAFLSVTSNEREVATTVFPVNETETVANSFTAQGTQVCVPPSESGILVPRRRRSVPDLAGFACLASVEQDRGFRNQKKGRTKEECDNTKEVKEIGSCFRCRLKKKRVSLYFVVPLHGQQIGYPPLTLAGWPHGEWPPRIIAGTPLTLAVAFWRSSAKI